MQASLDCYGSEHVRKKNKAEDGMAINGTELEVVVVVVGGGVLIHVGAAWRLYERLVITSGGDGEEQWV